MAGDARPIWGPTRAFGRAVVFVGAVVTVAIALGRYDLVFLAGPFALGTAWSLRRRPTQAPRVGLTVPDGPMMEAADLTAVLTVGNPDPVELDVVVARVSHSRWLKLRYADRPHATSLPPGMATDVRLTGPALRWGRHRFGPANLYGVACDGLLISETFQAAGERVKVYPFVPQFHAVDAMPNAAGLVGAHHSRRPGEGGELAGVRAFGPGDRLRRIDWRVTLRTRQLHVAQTLSDRDAEVVLILDLLTEAGRSGGVHGTASVLDTTVRAAAAITDHYLVRGDRVGLLEYSWQARRLKRAGGRRHFQTVQEWLLDCAKATAQTFEPSPYVFGPHLVPPTALVIVLTPLLDNRAAEMVAELARSGRHVVAIDTLGRVGAHAPAATSSWTGVAFQLWRLERANRIGQIREVGVPVVEWGGPGSLDEVLRDVTRLATAPRIRG